MTLHLFTNSKDSRTGEEVEQQFHLLYLYKYQKGKRSATMGLKGE